MKFTLSAVATLLLAASASAIKDCPDDSKWDAIVVGAGMAGSIIAAKIATQNPEKCVLVVEGGKNSGQVMDPISSDDAPPSHEDFFDDWEHLSSFKNETYVNTPGVYGEKLVCWGRDCEYVWGEDESRTPKGLIVGKLVGGSGAINGALMQYPPDYMWNPYPVGWKAGDMKPYLDEIEKTMKPTPIPSSDGVHYNDDLGANQVREALEAEGFKYSNTAAYYKPVGGTMGIPRVTVTNGRRSSSTSVYLKPALKNSNIKLWTSTNATKIVLDENKKATMTATGLEVDKDGKKETIPLAEGGLVVVSAGGAKTPVLLLDSDIGPSGTKVKNDAVGKGLTDKSMTWIYFKVPGVGFYNYTSPPKKDQEDFVMEGKGPLTQYGPLLVGFMDIDSEVTGGRDGDNQKNIVEFFVAAGVEPDVVRVNFVHLTPKKDQGGATITKDLKVTVTPGQYDTDFSEASLNKAKEIITDAMKKKGYDLAEDKEAVGLNNMNHPGGTCGLGKCISSDTLIVNGLDNVAVCDNSIVPEQATLHTALSLMAIASKGGDILNTFWKDAAPNDEL